VNLDDLRIRPATRRDRSALVALHEALYITHREKVTPPALDAFFAHKNWRETLRDDVDSLLSGSGSVVLLAEHANEVIGYVTAHIEDDPRRVLSRRGVVEDWFVDERARGKGAGKRLLFVLEEILREAGCVSLESATWTFNEGARRAHEAAGFAEAEIRYRKRL
jgi:GNAT superfamily N-acetyltransferase